MIIATKVRYFALCLAILFSNISQTYARDIIAVMTPLSGRYASLGNSIATGAKLAMKQVSGAKSAKLLIVDSACNVKTTKRALEKLQKPEVKIIIGPICSPVIEAVFSDEFFSRIPVLSAYVQNQQLGRRREEQNLPYYSLANAPGDEPKMIAKTIVERWSGVPFAILDDGTVFGRGLADSVRVLLEDQGRKPIAVANFRPLQTNQQALLRRISKTGMEAVFIAGEADDIAVISRDLAKLELEIEILGPESLLLLPHTNAPKDVSEGLLALFPRKANSYPLAAALLKSMKKRGVKLDGAALRGYAMVQIALAALKTGNNNPDVSIRLSGPYETLFGPVEFNGLGHAREFPIILHEWKKGKFQPLNAGSISQ